MLKRLKKANFVSIGRGFCICNFSLIIIIIISTFYINLNWGIDFSSGTMYEIVFEGEKYPDISEIRDYLDKKDYKGCFVQNFGSDKNIAIKIKTHNSISEISKFKEVFFQYFELEKGYNLSFYKTEFVGAGVSSYIIKSGFVSILLALLGVMGYLSFRFNAKFAIAAIVALMNDIMITFGLFFFAKLEFNTSSVAALLTIIGYSINDTVVIFDRIRGILIYSGLGMSTDIINASVSQCLKRTSLTSCTTIIACATLAFFTRGEVRDFGIVVMFGVCIGTISSIFIATSIIDSMYILETRLQKYRNV